MVASAPTNPLSPSSALIDAGRPFGRYRLLEELGRGGMGVVWKAFDTDLHRTVALKLIRSAEFADATEVERFRREARAAGRLRHPHIVPVHDVGMFDGQHYFTSDFIDGVSLERLRKAGTVPARDAIRIIQGVAEALHCAHGQGIVHRDVKPANILLDRQGQPFLTDFGLAKEVGPGTTGPTLSGELLGTPAFMSPEQASGSARAIGPASDQWSLGVTLYLLLTEVLPFTAEGVGELVFAILGEEPIPPCVRNRKIHPDVQTIILKALEKDPRRRYASLADLAADLGRYLDGEPISARPVGRLARWRRRAARHPRTIAAVAAGALLGLVGLGYAIHAAAGREEARSGQSRSEADLARMRAVSDLQRIWNGRIDALRELDSVRHDARLASDERLARADKIWPRLAGFESEVDPDPAVRAVARSLLGWARWLAGRTEEGMAWMEEARHEAGALPQPALLLSFVLFSDYVDELRASPTRAGASGQVSAGPPEETPRMRDLRVRIQALLAEAASCPAWASQGLDDFRAVVDGIEAMHRGEYEAAERGFTRAIGSQDLRAFEPILRRARAVARGGAADFRGARADYDEVARIRPGDTHVRHRAACALLDEAMQVNWQGKNARHLLTDAATRLDEALALDAHFALGWNARSAVRLLLDDLPGALEDARRALQLEPGNAAFLTMRSAIHAKREDWAASRADAEAALAIAPGRADALRNRALARHMLEDFDGAIADADAALASEPESDHSWNIRALAREKKGDLDGAIADYGTAIRLSPHQALFRKNRAAAYIRKGDLESARADLDQAIVIDAAWAVAWNERGCLRFRQGDLKGAVDDFTEALRLSPRYALAYINRGSARYLLGDPAGGIADFDAAHSLDPRNPESLNGRGWAWHRLGDRERATRDFEAALALRPDYPEALRGRGQVRLDVGDFQGARSDFEHALRVAPSTWPARAAVELLRDKTKAQVGDDR